jgi:hypothetical protein
MDLCNGNICAGGAYPSTARRARIEREDDHMRILALAAVLAVTYGGVAFASSCPTQVKAIDQALAGNASLSAEKKAAAKKLRDEGEALHASGKHAESMAKLGEAKKIVGLQ